MRVIKRNGSHVDFDSTKIQAAIQKAIDATQEYYNSGILNANQITALIVAQIYSLSSERVGQK